MAVVQISKVQVRRGLQQDLPQLSSGEFGWSIDTQRLFIGNGGAGEGAPEEGITELLTLKRLVDELPNVTQYEFKGDWPGYTVLTGYDLNHPTIRTFQRKLDEWVSVRDFGALGDGVTDDTEAINRTILQVYGQSYLQGNTRVRRTIKFEAGTYIVNSALIKLPPWIRLIGDGKDSSFIKFTGAGYLLKTCDASYAVDGLIGSGVTTLPKHISIENLTIHSTVDQDLIILDSASHVNFHSVQFLGPLSGVNSSGSSAAVRLVANDSGPTNINFDFCSFVGVRNAVVSDVSSSNVKFNACYFYDLYKGIVLGESSTSDFPSSYKIFNSFFINIAHRAIDCYDGVTGVISNNNTFVECGNNQGGTGNAISTIVNFADNGNYSIADTFERNDGDAVGYPRVYFGNTQTVYLGTNKGLVLGTATVGMGDVVTLLDNTGSYTSTGIELTSPCIFNYSITRGTTYRIGSIAFANDGTGPEYSEQYSESKNPTGITFLVNSSNQVTFRSTNIGQDATLKYNINHF